MNFKTVMRLAKLAWNKKEFSLDGFRVANADNHVMVWAPSESDLARDLDGNEALEPDPSMLDTTRVVLEELSVPLGDMVKVNSNYLRRAISAIETKGNAPMYLDIKSKRIVIAYEVDGEVHRAAIACMKNEGGSNGHCV